VASPSPADGRKKAPAEIIPASASARKPTRYWLVKEVKNETTVVTAIVRISLS
jgi:hypothetical protein